MAHEAARVATLDDVDALAALCREAAEEIRVQRGGLLWIAEHARVEPVERSLAADVGDVERLVGVGTVDGTVVGYASVRDQRLRNGGHLGMIDELFVHPEARGVGVGEALMGLIEPWCAERGLVGIDAVALPGNRHTKNFFESFGLVARAIVVHRAVNPIEPVDPGNHDHHGS
jgi:GNAT superfamily N-acetyltransferase